MRRSGHHDGLPRHLPRGADVPGEDDAYDLGTGAGFYVDATAEPWSANYKMYRYVTEELPALVEANLPATSLKSITGHSMGGHGALTIAFKNPDAYASVSAFAPICNPTAVPWGEKAFGAYLGSTDAGRRMTRASSSVLAGRRSSSSTTSWSIRAWTISS